MTKNNQQFKQKWISRGSASSSQFIINRYELVSEVNASCVTFRTRVNVLFLNTSAKNIINIKNKKNGTYGENPEYFRELHRGTKSSNGGSRVLSRLGRVSGWHQSWLGPFPTYARSEGEIFVYTKANSRWNANQVQVVYSRTVSKLSYITIEVTKEILAIYNHSCWQHKASSCC